MRRRSHEIANLRKIVSKDDSTVQLQREIQVMPREERKQLLKEANFEAEIPPAWLSHEGRPVFTVEQATSAQGRKACIHVYCKKCY